MKLFIHFGCRVCFIAFCLWIVGCSRGTNISGLVPCSGRITLDGQPLSDATINFVPQGGGVDVRSAFSKSDRNGAFETFTAAGNKGLLPGEYVVTVTKHDYATDADRIVDNDRKFNRSSDNVKFITEGDQLKSIRIIDGKEYPDEVNLRLITPSKYANTKTSDLKIVIPAEGNKGIKLELTK